jgi:hypothetical protein
MALVSVSGFMVALLGRAAVQALGRLRSARTPRAAPAG